MLMDPVASSPMLKRSGVPGLLLFATSSVLTGPADVFADHGAPSCHGLADLGDDDDG